MGTTFTPTHRALAVGGLAAALLIGAFTLGNSRGSAAAASSAGRRTSAAAGPTVMASTTGSARITVTGTGNVTGTPNQLVLAMGVQVNGSSVGSALAAANDAVTRVTATLRAPRRRCCRHPDDLGTFDLAELPSRLPDAQRLQRERVTHGHVEQPGRRWHPD